MAGIGLTRCPLDDLPVDPAAYLEAIQAYAEAEQNRTWLVGDDSRWVVGQVINTEGGFERWR